MLVKADCGQKTNQMTTYFQNSGWPEASRDRIICTLTVELQPDVTQILLDFILFEVSFSAILIFEQRKCVILIGSMPIEVESTD